MRLKSLFLSYVLAGMRAITCWKCTFLSSLALMFWVSQAYGWAMKDQVHSPTYKSPKIPSHPDAKASVSKTSGPKTGATKPISHFPAYFQGRSRTRVSLENWIDIVAAHNNPALSHHKLRKVHSQLVGYSRKNFKVYPYQTNHIGLAQPGGKIMIDISVIGKPLEIVAFWLAHEWGHHDLGHAINRFTTPQTTINAFLRRRNMPTASEDEADIWAAKFMAHHRYRLEPVLEYLCGLRHKRFNKTHSSWQQRAINVAQAYNKITGLNVTPSCQRPTYRSAALLLGARGMVNATRGCRSCRSLLVDAPLAMGIPSYVRWCMTSCQIK